MDLIKIERKLTMNPVQPKFGNVYLIPKRTSQDISALSRYTKVHSRAAYAKITGNDPEKFDVTDKITHEMTLGEFAGMTFIVDGADEVRAKDLIEKFQPSMNATEADMAYDELRTLTMDITSVLFQRVIDTARELGSLVVVSSETAIKQLYGMLQENTNQLLHL